MTTKAKSKKAAKRTIGKPRGRGGVKAVQVPDVVKEAPAAPSGKVLMLRTCAADMTAHGGFLWPESGPVFAPDWKAEAQCGNGLHGLLWGEGDAGHLSAAPDAKWLVVEVDAATVIDLSGKVKFPRGIVAFCGDRLGATTYLAANGGHGRSIAFGTATAGYAGTATAGDWGTATAGDAGTATAGARGTATAGDSGTATAGDAGEIRIRYWDEKNSRYRTVIGFTGEDGIEANTSYILDESTPPKLVKKPA
jgi:hypothetical protein